MLHKVIFMLTLQLHLLKLKIRKNINLSMYGVKTIKNGCQCLRLKIKLKRKLLWTVTVKLFVLKFQYFFQFENKI